MTNTLDEWFALGHEKGGSLEQQNNDSVNGSISKEYKIPTSHATNQVGKRRKFQEKSDKKKISTNFSFQNVILNVDVTVCHVITDTQARDSKEQLYVPQLNSKFT